MSNIYQSPKSSFRISGPRVPLFPHSNNISEIPPTSPTLNSTTTPGDTTITAENTASLLIPHIDSLISEYLFFRGFTHTLNSFTTSVNSPEVESHSYAPKAIHTALFTMIKHFDYDGVVTFWKNLSVTYFSRLPEDHTLTINRLEVSTFRFMIIHFLRHQRQDLVQEFFAQYSESRILADSSWKHWFPIAFLQNPINSPLFKVYFSRQWVDTFITSLYNFLSLVFFYVPLPRIFKLPQVSEKLEQAETQVASLLKLIASKDAQIASLQNQLKTVQEYNTASLSMMANMSSPHYKDHKPSDSMASRGSVDSHVLFKSSDVRANTNRGTDAFTFSMMINSESPIESSPLMRNSSTSLDNQNMHSDPLPPESAESQYSTPTKSTKSTSKSTDNIYNQTNTSTDTPNPDLNQNLHVSNVSNVSNVSDANDTLPTQNESTLHSTDIDTDSNTHLVKYVATEDKESPLLLFKWDNVDNPSLRQESTVLLEKYCDHPITRLKFSPDSQWLVIGTRSSNLYLSSIDSDPKTPTHLWNTLEMPPGTDSILSLSWKTTSRESFVLVGNNNGQVHLIKPFTESNSNSVNRKSGHKSHLSTFSSSDLSEEFMHLDRDNNRNFPPLSEHDFSSSSGSGLFDDEKGTFSHIHPHTPNDRNAQNSGHSTSSSDSALGSSSGPSTPLHSGSSLSLGVGGNEGASKIRITPQRKSTIKSFPYLASSFAVGASQMRNVVGIASSPTSFQMVSSICAESAPLPPSSISDPNLASYINSAAFHPDYPLPTSKGRLVLWDLRNAVQLAQLECDSRIHTMQYTSNGSLLVTGAADGKLRIFDVKNNKLVQEIQASSQIFALSLNSHESEILTLTSDGILSVWSFHRLETPLTCFQLFNPPRNVSHSSVNCVTGHTFQIPLCSTGNGVWLPPNLSLDGGTWRQDKSPLHLTFCMGARDFEGPYSVWNRTMMDYESYSWNISQKPAIPVFYSHGWASSPILKLQLYHNPEPGWPVYKAKTSINHQDLFTMNTGLLTQRNIFSSVPANISISGVLGGTSIPLTQTNINNNKTGNREFQEHLAVDEFGVVLDSIESDIVDTWDSKRWTVNSASSSKETKGLEKVVESPRGRRLPLVADFISPIIASDWKVKGSANKNSSMLATGNANGMVVVTKLTQLE